MGLIPSLLELRHAEPVKDALRVLPLDRVVHEVEVADLEVASPNQQTSWRTTHAHYRRRGPGSRGQRRPKPQRRLGDRPEAPTDGAAHLISHDGRGISFRPVYGGTIVELWVTGNPAPPSPADATPAEQAAYEAQVAVCLPRGQRYNKAASLVTENDEEPEDIIMRTLEDVLLPAFEYKPGYVGHRPWLDLFDNALSDVMDEVTSAVGTSLRDCGPEVHTGPHNVGESPETPADAEPGSAAEEPPQPAAAEDAPHAPASPAVQPSTRAPRKRAARTTKKRQK